MKTILVAAAIVMGALIALPVIAQEQKAADQQMIDKAFDGMDTNQNGSIDRAELGVYLQAIVDKQRADFDAAFDEMDTSKDGKIDKEEAKANSIIATYFDPLDTDKDGFLSKAEMDAAMEAAAKMKN